MKRFSVRSALVSAALVGVFGLTAPVEAATISIRDCYTGGCAVVTGSIDIDIVQAGNRVKLTMTNNTNGFLTKMGLFYNGWSSGVLENFDDLVGIVASPSLTGAPNGLGSVSQLINFGFGYQTSNGSGRFNPGEQVEFFLKSASGLSVSNFGTGGFAHVQGLPDGTSVKLRAGNPPVQQVPEPMTAALVASAAAAWALTRRRQ